MSAELSFVPTRDDAALSELRNDCDKLRAETERVRSASFSTFTWLLLIHLVLIAPSLSLQIREEISRLPPLPAAGAGEEVSACSSWPW